MVAAASHSPWVSPVLMLNALGAARVIDAAHKEAVRLGRPVVVAVTDCHGFLLSSSRMDGAPLFSIDLAHAKARTAAILKIPSIQLQQLVDGGKYSYLSATDITPLEGGLPLLLDAAVVGAIGVSGAEADEDSKIAAAGARALTPHPAVGA
jgi:glc operon protein GlcG